MKRALLFLCLAAVLTGPALGQETADGDELLARACDRSLDPKTRDDALMELVKRSQSGTLPDAEGIAALTELVRDGDAADDLQLKGLGALACWILATAGAEAEPALLVVLDALRNGDNHYHTGKLKLDLGEFATGAALKIGKQLKGRGRVLWWAVPYAYRYEGFGLLVMLVLWFAAAPTQRRRYPSHLFARLVFLAVVAGIPAFLASAAVHHAMTQDWAAGFLPETLTVVPLPVAAVLSVVFCCALAAVWAEQRGSRALEPVLLEEPVEGGAGDT